MFGGEHDQVLQPHVASEIDRLEWVAIASAAPVDVTADEAASVGFLEAMESTAAGNASDRLAASLRDHGASVLDLAEDTGGSLVDPQLANRVFVRDVATTVGSSVVLGRAGAAAREMDFAASHRMLRRAVASRFFIDGNVGEFGDLLVLSPGHALVNVGHRTPAARLERLRQVSTDIGLHRLDVLKLPRRIELAHLDLAVNVLGPEVLLASASATTLDIHSFTRDESAPTHFKQMAADAGRELVVLPDRAFALGDVNFIHTRPDTVLTSARARCLPQIAREAGVNVDLVDLDPLLSGGGGMRCLTLPLRRGASAARSDG